MTTKPALDPELAAFLASRPFLSAPLRADQIARARAARAPYRTSDIALAQNGAVTVEEIEIPSSTTGVALKLLVLGPARAMQPRQGVCFFHGGGMVFDDNRAGIEAVLDWVDHLGVIVASVDYRVAPENPHPVPVEDCYATFEWLNAHRGDLGMSADPLVVVGASAGGGLAAGVALLSRARGGSKIAELLLFSPMIDDQARFPSSVELNGEAVWDSASNSVGWNALLAGRAGSANVDSIAAPSRETNLARLPPTFVDVGEIETFRDESIDFAERLQAAGVETELHVWKGAFHGFDVIAPESALSKAARKTRIDYLRRRLGGKVSA